MHTVKARKNQIANKYTGFSHPCANRMGDVNQVRKYQKPQKLKTAVQTTALSGNMALPATAGFAFLNGVGIKGSAAAAMHTVTGGLLAGGLPVAIYLPQTALIGLAIKRMSDEDAVKFMDAVGGKQGYDKLDNGIKTFNQAADTLQNADKELKEFEKKHLKTDTRTDKTVSVADHLKEQGIEEVFNKYKNAVSGYNTAHADLTAITTEFKSLFQDLDKTIEDAEQKHALLSGDHVRAAERGVKQCQHHESQIEQHISHKQKDIREATQTWAEARKDQRESLVIAQKTLSVEDSLAVPEKAKTAQSAKEKLIDLEKDVKSLELQLEQAKQKTELAKEQVDTAKTQRNHACSQIDGNEEQALFHLQELEERQDTLKHPKMQPFIPHMPEIPPAFPQEKQDNIDKRKDCLLESVHKNRLMERVSATPSDKPQTLLQATTNFLTRLPQALYGAKEQKVEDVPVPESPQPPASQFTAFDFVSSIETPPLNQTALNVARDLIALPEKPKSSGLALKLLDKKAKDLKTKASVSDITTSEISMTQVSVPKPVETDNAQGLTVDIPQEGQNTRQAHSLPASPLSSSLKTKVPLQERIASSAASI